MLKRIKRRSVYGKMILMCVESMLTYRGSLLIEILTDCLKSVSTFLVILFSFFSFQTFRGYDLSTVVFIFTFAHLSYGFCMLFFSSMRYFGDIVKEGTLDIIMVKPVNTMAYLCCRSVDISSFSHIIISIILFLCLADTFHIEWSLLKVVLFIISLIGSTLLQAGVLIFIASMAFTMVDVRGLDNLYAGFREFIWYPLVVFSKPVQFILLSFIPLGYISFVPCGIFIKHSVVNMMPGFLIYLSPLIGLFVFIAACVFWNKSMNQYHSTGC